MTREELTSLKAKLTVNFTKTGERIRERKRLLATLGIPKTQDAELLELKATAAKLNAKLSIVNAELAKTAPPPPPVNEFKKERVIPLLEDRYRDGGIWGGCNRYELRVISLMIQTLGEDKYKAIIKLASEDQKGHLARDGVTVDELTAKVDATVEERANRPSLTRDESERRTVTDRDEQKPQPRTAPKVNRDMDFYEIAKMMRNNYNQFAGDEI